MDLSKYLENAADAAKRRQYPTAVKIYAQVLQIQPDYGEARAGLRRALFARNAHERGYLSHYLDHEVKAARRTFWFMERMRWFQFVATLSLQVGLIAYAARLWMDQNISVGSFAMVASLLLLVINDLRNLSRRFLEFFEYVGNITDGVGIIVRPPARALMLTSIGRCRSATGVISPRRWCRGACSRRRSRRRRTGSSSSTAAVATLPSWCGRWSARSM